MTLLSKTIEQQLAEFNLSDEYVFDEDISLEEIGFEPLFDFAERLSTWGKGNNGAELTIEQVKALIKGGSIFAKHSWGEFFLLLLVDEQLQRLFLLISKDKSRPHFCFMTI
jgi:hypothetical protein